MPAFEPHYERLKARQRAERDAWPEALGLRVHRALSWLNRAEQCGDDVDARFIFLWISFNAAYAQLLSMDDRAPETVRANQFIRKLVDLDQQGALHALLWDAFPGSIRVLLSNHYIFQPFWDAQMGEEPSNDWRERFESANRLANQALGRGDTATLLSVVLARLYTLRNQLVHGGATWNSSVNRDQLRDCTRLLGNLVPAVIEIMMDHPRTLWGAACYPVV
ncbi:MAG: HEPN domain-containing protein [Lamprobacter sp.]|uniref:hypothetical protein n=1 Tax=Lamprobacter sp. TaxID=3100796 RepID=UPI002B2579FC|nr:hypothetical protein [Lamprobacter sp.]MEA3642645.1 HEPN domain-containing protein [Lamprobacter sp.]